MTIAIQGVESAIGKALCLMLPDDETVTAVRRGSSVHVPHADRYVFLSGYMAGRRIGQLGQGQHSDTWHTNFANVAVVCDHILARHRMARIVVVGSHSVDAGSYDMAYAGAKAALHAYVRTKRLAYPEQQLVCVAPSIIGDAGMTVRRPDTARLAQRRQEHRKKRFIEAREVAALIRFLLYEDRGYITGTVIDMHGGPS